MTARDALQPGLLALSLAGALVQVAVAGAGHGSIPVCTASQLSPVFISSSPGAGSVTAEFGFRNTTTRRCGLRGYPTVQMLTKTGRPLPTTDVRSTPVEFGIAGGPVSLEHGAVAYLGVHYAAQTGYGRLSCPTAGALRLTAPGTSEGLLLQGRGAQIQPYGGTIPHLHCGILRVSPVTAKRFQ